MKTTSRTLLLGLMTLAVGSAWAFDPIPKESGFSGRVILGGGYVVGENNLVKGNALVQIGVDRVDNLTDSPDDESNPMPVVSGQLQYTFASTKTQLFFGQDIEDLVRFDFATAFGVRQGTERLGRFSLALLTSGIVTEVWEDPYVAGVDRDSTDRDVTGFRAEWYSIFNSNFFAQISAREIDIDKERSGQLGGLDLTPEEIDLLRRDGDSTNFRLGYVWKFTDKRFLVPEFSYTDDDRDGGAVKNERYSGQVSYTSLGPTWSYVVSGGYISSEYDQDNPIYDKASDSDTWFGGLSVFYKLNTQSKRWSLVGQLSYGEEDSDIDFHDSSLFIGSIGAMYVFD
jgi:hypothetical protein